MAGCNYANKLILNELNINFIMMNIFQKYLFILMFPLFAISQTNNNIGLRAIYKISPNEYQKPIEERENKEDAVSEIKNQMLSDYSIMINEGSKIIEFTLIYKNNKKHFSRNSFIIPEFLTKYQASFMANFKDEIHYSDYQNNIYINHYEFQGKYYNIINNERKDEWEILPETKLINNFLCYKAVKKGNNIPYPIIWFAPELNFPIGPHELNNFPGMVLEVDYKLFSIFCEKIEFEKDGVDFGPIKQPQGIQMTVDEIKKIFDKAKRGLTD